MGITFYSNESNSTDHHAFVSQLTIAAMAFDCYYVNIADVKLPV